MFTQSGDGFDATYPLASGRWKYKKKAGANRGYKFKEKPFKSVLVRPGMIRVVAKGLGLEQSLGSDPRPVHVQLMLGAQRYCMTFGGDVTFAEGKKFRAKDAPPPPACADAGSPLR